MKNENPLEKIIERRVCEYARSLHCLAYKFTSPATRHVPDRIIITPNGVIAFLEFKRRGEVPTAAQAVEHAKMRKCKVLVFVVDSVEQGKDVINSLLV